MTRENELAAWYKTYQQICSTASASATHAQARKSVEDEVDTLRRALASLVIGVEELMLAWPDLTLPTEGHHNDLIGFLFATLPIAQKALKKGS